MTWTELFSSLHLASSTSQAEQKRCWLLGEGSRLVSHLYPCQWPCSQRRLRGTVGRTQTLHAASLVCSAIPLVQPWLTPSYSGLEDKSFAENFQVKWSIFSVQVQHCLLSFKAVTLKYQMCFCSYIQQQNLLRHFFPFQLRQACKYYFPLLQPCWLCGALFTCRRSSWWRAGQWQADQVSASSTPTAQLPARVRTDHNEIRRRHLHSQKRGCCSQGSVIHTLGSQTPSWWDVGKGTRRRLGPINHKISWGRAMSWRATETAHQDALLLGQMSK